jgi:Ca2+-binding RTX toxin-like protein
VIQALASIASVPGVVILGDIDGGQGDDRIGVQMEVGAETIAMPLRTWGGSGDDSISVEAWNTAAFFAGDVATRTLGDAGDDVIQVDAFIEARNRGGAVETIVDGGEGDDRITARSGGGAAGQTNLLRGRNGADVILSEQEAQGAQSPAIRATLDGGGGRDRLTAIVRAGHETLNPDVATSLLGGAGDDALSVSALLTAGTFYFPPRQRPVGRRRGGYAARRDRHDRPDP